MKMDCKKNKFGNRKRARFQIVSASGLVVSNVSRVWKPDETLALVFEIVLEKLLTSNWFREDNFFRHCSSWINLFRRFSRIIGKPRRLQS